MTTNIKKALMSTTAGGTSGLQSRPVSAAMQPRQECLWGEDRREFRCPENMILANGVLGCLYDPASSYLSEGGVDLSLDVEGRHSISNAEVVFSGGLADWARRKQGESAKPVTSGSQMKMELVVETSEDPPLVTVFVTPEITFPERRFDEAAKLVNLINPQMRFGASVALIHDGVGIFHWHRAMDFEDAAMSPKQLSNCVHVGLHNCAVWWSQFMALGTTDKTAAEIVGDGYNDFLNR
jgi:hypothetical protein